MLTFQQIQWAAQHNWFVRDNGDGTITVRDVNPQWIETSTVWRKSFSALRDWAGY